MKNVKDIRDKIEFFFRQTLKLGDINKRKGTINCGRCYMQLDNYVRDGLVPDNAKAVSTQAAHIYTHPEYEVQSGGPLKILSSFTKDKRLLQRCAPLENHTYKLSLGNKEEVEIIDLTLAPTRAAIEQISLQRVDTTQGQAILISTLQSLARRAKDGTAYGCIILTWPSKEAHMLNFFVASKEDLSEVFFIDAQVGTISDTLSTQALPDIYFLQSMPPEGFEIEKNFEIKVKQESQDNEQETKYLAHPMPFVQALPLEMPTLETPALETSALEIPVLEIPGLEDPAFFPKEPLILEETTDAGLEPLWSNTPLSVLSQPSAFDPALNFYYAGLATFFSMYDPLQSMQPLLAPPIVKKRSASNAAALEEIQALTTLYRTQYMGLSVTQFYKIWSSEYAGKPGYGWGERSYGWVLNELQQVGLVPQKERFKVSNSSASVSSAENNNPNIKKMRTI